MHFIPTIVATLLLQLTVAEPTRIVFDNTPSQAYDAAVAYRTYAGVGAHISSYLISN
jgi:hypothetical protein